MNRSDKEQAQALLKECIHTDPTGNADRVKVDYDDRGNITEIVDGDNSKTSYSYVYGDNGRWTERVTTRQYGSDASSVTKAKEVRTFDNEGRVTDLDTYSYDADKDRWIPASSCAYDYEHQEDGQYGNIGNRAYCVKNVTYIERPDKEGTYYTVGEEYMWCEPLGMFFKCSSSYSQKEEVTKTDDGYVYSRMRFDQVSGEWTVIEKKEYILNMPTVDSYTEIMYAQLSDERLVLTGKYDYTYNWDAPRINDGKHRECNYYGYNDDGTWTKRCTRTRDWIEHPALNILREKVDYFNGNEEVHDYYYDDNGEEIPSSDQLYMTTDGSYFLPTYLYLDDNGASDEDAIYTYYNAQGQETGKVKMRNIGLIISTSASSITGDGQSYTPNTADVSGATNTEYLFEEYRNGEWKPLAGKIVVGCEDFYGDHRDHIEVTLNADGHPLEMKACRKDGHVCEIRTYSYKDNGYTRNVMRYDDELDKMVKDSDEEMTVDGDGTICDLFYEYGFDDENAGETIDYYVNGASKTLIYAAGKMEKYDWNCSDGKFEDVPTVYGITLSTTDGDGVTTRIERHWDGTGIVETGKERSWNSDDNKSSWNETYRKDNGEWVGVSKTTIDVVEKPQFDAVAPSDPLQTLDPYSDGTRRGRAGLMSGAKSGDDNAAETYQNHYEYTWDETANEWKPTDFTATSFETDGSVLTETDEISYNGTVNKIVTTTKRDGRNRMTELSRTETEDGLVSYKSVTSYEYDGDNLVKKTVAVTNSDGQTAEDVYQYIYIDATPDGVDGVADLSGVLSLVVNGRNISVSNGTRLVVYSVDGKKVTSGNGAVTVPVAGLYVVEAGGVKKKIVVR